MSGRSVTESQDRLKMNEANKPIIFIFVVFAAVAGIVGISKLREGSDRIPWRTNLSGAQSEARAQNKPVFAYFTATWCGPCQSMKKTTWSDKKVEEALSAYVPVKLDVDENTQLAMQYKASSIPLFVVMDDQGNVKASTSGALGPSEFLAWLNQSR